MARAEGSDWLSGSFDLEHVLHVLGQAANDRCFSWINGSDPTKLAAFTQLVEHVMMRRPVERAALVPGTAIRWEELEDAGMAYLRRECASPANSSAAVATGSACSASRKPM